jgi:hypothetical protein
MWSLDVFMFLLFPVNVTRSPGTRDAEVMTSTHLQLQLISGFAPGLLADAHNHQQFIRSNLCRKQAPRDLQKTL